MANKSDVARRVLSSGLQSWGQSVDERIQAWQGAYDFMNLLVRLGVGEKDGHKISTFDGIDAEQAMAFTIEVMQRFPIGSFEEEQAMIEDCLEKYKKV